MVIKLFEYFNESPTKDDFLESFQDYIDLFDKCSFSYNDDGDLIYCDIDHKFSIKDESDFLKLERNAITFPILLSCINRFLTMYDLEVSYLDLYHPVYARLHISFKKKYESLLPKSIPSMNLSHLKLSRYTGRSFIFPENTLYTEISRDEAFFFEKVLNLKSENMPNDNLEDLETEVRSGEYYDDSSISYYGDGDDDFIIIDLVPKSRPGAYLNGNEIVYTLYVGPRWVNRIQKMISG